MVCKVTFVVFSRGAIAPNRPPLNPPLPYSFVDLYLVYLGLIHQRLKLTRIVFVQLFVIAGRGNSLNPLAGKVTQHFPSALEPINFFSLNKSNSAATSH